MRKDDRRMHLIERENTPLCKAAGMSTTVDVWGHPFTFDESEVDCVKCLAELRRRRREATFAVSESPDHSCYLPGDPWCDVCNPNASISRISDRLWQEHTEAVWEYASQFARTSGDSPDCRCVPCRAVRAVEFRDRVRPSADA